jgi:TonB-dependent SusC/RagA subfamily outer membrane receptor
MVKSISILKGTAAAIYGSRATNGVILIDLIGAGNK